MKLTVPKLTKRVKIYLLAVVIVIVIVLAAAYQSGAFLCRLTDGGYIGQAVDGEQAIMKLSAYAGAVNRTNSPPLSLMAFNESKSERLEIKAWLNDEQVMMKGFVLDAPYRNGDRLNYGDAYFISDAGYIYKLSSPRC